MRLSILALFLFASVVAYGQSAPAHSTSRFGVAGPSFPPAGFSAVNGQQPSTPGATPAPNGRFRFNPNLSPPIGAPPVPPAQKPPHPPKLAQSIPPALVGVDPKMVIHPPQSAIGTLPPPIHVEPNFYPNLTLLYIHANPAAKAPAQPPPAP